MNEGIEYYSPILFTRYLESDGLFTIGFYLAAILYGWCPVRTFFNYPYCFFFHTITVVGHCLYITDISFFIHYKLNHRSVSTFRSPIICSYLGVTVSFQVLAPFAITTGKFGFDFNLVKYLILIVFLLFLYNLFSFINYNRGGNIFIFDTFLVNFCNFYIF